MEATLADPPTQTVTLGEPIAAQALVETKVTLEKPAVLGFDAHAMVESYTEKGMKIVGVIVEIKTCVIGRNPKQPRTEREKNEVDILAKSMRASGQGHAILVAKWYFPDRADLEYIIVGGETRWLAAQEIGMESLNCWVIDIKDEKELFEKSMIDNYVRNPLGNLDMVNGIATMKSFGDKPQEIADKLGMATPSVYGYLKINDMLKAEVIALLSIQLEPENRLRLQVAKLLTDYPEEQLELLSHVVGKSVKDAQFAIGKYIGTKKSAVGKKPRPSDISEIIRAASKRMHTETTDITRRLAENPKQAHIAINNMDPVARLSAIVCLTKSNHANTELMEKLKTGAGSEYAAIQETLRKEKEEEAAKAAKSTAAPGNGSPNGSSNGSAPPKMIGGIAIVDLPPLSPKTSWDELLDFMDKVRKYSEACNIPANLDIVLTNHSGAEIIGLEEKINTTRQTLERLHGSVKLRLQSIGKR